MSTLESVTYLPEKGLYCQRLPSSRTHGGTESLKGKNTDNMGFYGTLKMIFYKMKRKLDHGSEVRSFSLGKKPCKVSEYTRAVETYGAIQTKIASMEQWQH
uniref:F-box/WD repeat-containing protein 7 n=1 Tax=Sphaerodactylus townsendi TaxID=933632 RepID=A0ACB8E7P5_9SAUR